MIHYAIAKHQVYELYYYMNIGKTNHGRMIYGRATRHKNVHLCPLGALSMYLMLRFQITKEFSDPTFNWIDNSAWFDIKLLVDVNRSNDFTKQMTTNTYAKAIAQVLKSLGIIKTHLSHIGRVLGTKILEMLEVESEEIRRLGNWNPSIQDSSYSTKLPMKPIRRLAGFSTGNGIHFNPRTVVEVPMSLQKATPIGKWLFDAMERVAAANEHGGGKYTAQNFLQFLENLNIIFLQDMGILYYMQVPRSVVCLVLFCFLNIFAQMLLTHFWTRHPLFQTIDVLQSDQFIEFCDTMRNAIDNQASPLDATLESVLPGIHDRLDAQRKATKDLEEKVTEIGKNVNDTIIQTSRQSFQHFASIVSEINTIVQNRPPFEADIQVTPTGPSKEHEGTATTASNEEQNSTVALPEIQPRYDTLMELHDHWFGLGKFHGGISIDELETRHRNKWRKKYTSAQETQFSRAKRIIQAMKAEADQKNIDVHIVASSWSENFENDGRLTFPNVIKWLVENGFLARKKQRGNSKTS